MQQSQNPSISVVVAALFMAAGIAAAGWFVSRTIYNANVGVNTAEVKGLAERRVKADQVNWTIGYGVAGSSRDELPSLYKLAGEHQNAIVDLLKEGGFSNEEISAGVLDYRYEEFRDNSQRLVDQVHKLQGTIEVETSKVDQVAKARASLNQLIARGISVDNRPPKYRFTGLNAIKPDMVREATTNARVAAQEFADNAGVEVGGIRSARQGGFIIRDAGEDYGDTEKIDKNVRVVTTITFYLTR